MCSLSRLVIFLFFINAEMALAQYAIQTNPGPANGLDHIYRSLNDLRDEARAQAGYHKPRWVCHTADSCEWQPGYWGPPPLPRNAPVRIRPLDPW